ncbi:MAG: hypothetical protein J5I98_25215 [Phaeodactylibacter sp.]|nr:hypothetical protein [Phaeodactylibacter sp.]
MSTCYFFSTDDELVELLASQARKENILLQPFQAGSPPEEGVVLLFSPILANGHYLSCEKLWKNYFQQEHPEVKLVTAGFEDARQKNHIDLLRLPDNLSEVFQNALTCREAWEPVAAKGKSVMQLLARFLEGHGGDSLLAAFSRLRRLLQIARDEKAQFGTGFEEIWDNLLGPNDIVQRWHVFINRWAGYYPYFTGLPFYPVFQFIESKANAIDPIIKGQQASLLEEPWVLDNITEISAALKRIEKYVY